MARPLSEQLRQAIRASEMSRYAICKATGIDQASMSKFMKRKVGLSLASVDKLTKLLGLELAGQDKSSEVKGRQI